MSGYRRLLSGLPAWSVVLPVVAVIGAVSAVVSVLAYRSLVVEGSGRDEVEIEVNKIENEKLEMAENQQMEA